MNTVAQFVIDALKLGGYTETDIETAKFQSYSMSGKTAVYEITFINEDTGDMDSGHVYIDLEKGTAEF